MPFKKGQISWNRGKKLSVEHRKKLSDAHKKIGDRPPSRKGVPSPMKGKTFPQLTGEKNYNWKGGKRQFQHLNQQLRVAGRPKTNYCEICGSTKKICFDHDHQTGKFRGWICFKCNAALGMVNDNVKTLQALIDYLLKINES